MGSGTGITGGTGGATVWRAGWHSSAASSGPGRTQPCLAAKPAHALRADRPRSAAPALPRPAATRRRTILQRLSRLQAAPGVAFHERAPDGLGEDDMQVGAGEAWPGWQAGAGQLGAAGAALQPCSPGPTRLEPPCRPRPPRHLTRPCPCPCTRATPLPQEVNMARPDQSPQRLWDGELDPEEEREPGATGRRNASASYRWAAGGSGRSVLPRCAALWCTSG